MVLKGILEFLRILDEFKLKNSRYNSSLRILKFSRNSKIPYRDPPRGLGDDRKSDPQKGNSKIPRNSK